MSITLYEFSVPGLIRGLTNMSAILDKAAAYAAAKKFDPLILAQSRLFPDMHPLTRQVQIACDTAKGAAGRLADIEVPKHEDTEASLKSVTAAQVNGAENRTIEIKFPSGGWKFSGAAYITDFVMPNFYFHLSMVYALLRQSGVEIGKSDFLGAIQ
jgi:hypothetical protein